MKRTHEFIYRYLRLYYDQMTIFQASHRLGVQERVISRVLFKRGIVKRKRWSKEEIEFIKEYKGIYSNGELSDLCRQKFGTTRSGDAIKQLTLKHGIQRTKEEVRAIQVKQRKRQWKEKSSNKKIKLYKLLDLLIDISVEEEASRLLIIRWQISKQMNPRKFKNPDVLEAERRVEVLEHRRKRLLREYIKTVPGRTKERYLKSFKEVLTPDMM